MGNIKRKQEKKLQSRIESFDEVSDSLKRNGAFKRPGSQNRHKQHGGTERRGGAKRTKR